MANITIDLGVAIEEGGLKRLGKVFRKCPPGMKLPSALNQRTPYEEEILIKELERMGYDYQSYGGRGNDFYVIVKKRLH